VSGVAFDFRRLVLRRDPYVIGCAPGVLDPARYADLVAAFPPSILFRSVGAKQSLSEVNHRDLYEAFLARTPCWQAVWTAIKAPTFADEIRALLAAHDVTLPDAPLRARFEFAAMPACGGELRPHRDLASKVVTIVVSMLSEASAWDPAWGGSTDVLVPHDSSAEWRDYQAPLEAFDVVHRYPYVPNQAVVFVKSDTSWHAVGPLTGGPTDPPRRTITINLETLR
jgi:hypothetical protein